MAEAAHIDRATIDRLTDPANYLGPAPQMVDRVVRLSNAVAEAGRFFRTPWHS